MSLGVKRGLVLRFRVVKARFRGSNNHFHVFIKELFSSSDRCGRMLKLNYQHLFDASHMFIKHAR